MELCSVQGACGGRGGRGAAATAALVGGAGSWRRVLRSRAAVALLTLAAVMLMQAAPAAAQSAAPPPGATLALAQAAALNATGRNATAFDGAKILLDNGTWWAPDFGWWKESARGVDAPRPGGVPIHFGDAPQDLTIATAKAIGRDPALGPLTKEEKKRVANEILVQNTTEIRLSASAGSYRPWAATAALAGAAALALAL
ncbi:hypothetical protein Rsub_01557 [Raphidocelis subcapitata]|uniref:Uncharacterized protein n=1 Tax=Raphidocelis subcapitata TaxID=307507 RepID=A0A2V0NMD0_9CHLO|nr:hypothetical protein Rsub_01557 [Raphidocelis subcapitata]|eukprot:GBF88658.1 hypothetical protein Rsub_01557 [Raphidocelis subcapitata]